MSKERAGVTRECDRHGQYVGGTCPVCDGIQKPPGRPHPTRYQRETDVDAALRRRPPSGPVEE